MTDWLLLTATLPTHPSGLRVRVWRALKATGAVPLREGAYLLPAAAATAPSLVQLQATIAQAGAAAHLLALRSRDAGQESAFRALFDRGDAHAALVQDIKALRTALPRATEADLRRGLRALESRWQALQAADFFPGPASARSAAALAALRRDLQRQLAPGEPAAAASRVVRRELADYQGRTWATRARPWIDRLATAWLVSRHIDRQARFVWLAAGRRCPKSALGYDFDGAAFSHVGERVTFEVVAESFGLGADPALRRLGTLVHYLDVGGMPVDEAPGLEAIVRGLQALHPKDDDLLAAALPVFDALHGAFRAPSTGPEEAR